MNYATEDTILYVYVCMYMHIYVPTERPLSSYHSDLATPAFLSKWEFWS